MTLPAEVFRSSAAMVPTFEIIFPLQQGGGDRSAAAEILRIRFAVGLHFQFSFFSEFNQTETDYNLC